jgi:general secretion pathway protein F
VKFEVKVLSEAGAVSALECGAASATDAASYARSLGLTVLSVKPKRGFTVALPGRRFPLLLFSQELLALIRSGLPLVEGLETLRDKETDSGTRHTLDRVIASVRQGAPLSRTLAAFPQEFPELFVATLRAGENTGELGFALERYIAYQTQVEAIRKKVVSASIYPLLLLGVGGVVVLFLLLYVVPKFANVFAERAATGTAATRILVGWSELVEGRGPLVLAVVLALGVLAYRAARSGPLRRWVEARLWSVSAVRERLKVFQLSRFYRTVGMLLRGGIPLVAAMRLASGLLGDRLQARLDLAVAGISQGRPVAPTMEANELTTAVAARMLAVGERSGNMPEMMERIAQFHDEETGRWVEWASRVFEPALMALIGVVIGAIVILMYLPIFELAGELR